jgi:hypothetical protein
LVYKIFIQFIQVFGFIFYFSLALLQNLFQIHQYHHDH